MALKPRPGATYALVLLGILIEDKDGLFGRDATGLVELATSGGCFVEIWRVATPSLHPCQRLMTSRIRTSVHDVIPRRHFPKTSSES